MFTMFDKMRYVFFIVFCSYWFCTLFVNYQEDSEFNIF
ncbi:putative membrane protein [Escherichia coli DEC5E]|nr:putative membrane protein [Escherichia coli DEC5E]